MKLAITVRIRKLFDRYWVRITIGALFSLLVHGLILSLQLGTPGFGLPSLELPWSERRAQTPDLSIRIANLASAPTLEEQAPHPFQSDAMPKAEQAPPSNDQPLTELPNARVKQSPLQSASDAPRVSKALESTPAIAQAVRKKGTPPPEDQSSSAPAHSQTKLIALTDLRPDSFIVPAPDEDTWWRTAPKPDNTAVPTHPLEEATTAAIALQTPKKSLEQAAEPTPAVQKPTEQESFERPDETQATAPQSAKTPDVAMEQAERKQGEEIAQQEAVRKQEEQQAELRAQDLETKKQEDARKQAADEAARLLAEQKLEEEQATQRAAELAQQKQEEAKKQEAAEAERQEKELEAHKQADEITRQQVAALALQKQEEEAKKKEQEQAEQRAIALAAQKQAEEIARQKAAALERQKQEEQLAAEKKAQELAAQKKEEEKKAEAAAAIQRENNRLAAAAATSSGTGSTGNENGTGNQPRGSSASNLANQALEQIGKIDLMRAEPLPHESNRPEANPRRHSILGMIDHDPVLEMYKKGWRDKIERTTGSLNYSQSSKDKARENPVVTVAIRSDGSLENIDINRSSGVADLDEAVRRIVRLNSPYSVFPANLTRKYDVIEIRSVWNFDDRLTLLEELH